MWRALPIVFSFHVRTCTCMIAGQHPLIARPRYSAATIRRDLARSLEKSLSPYKFGINPKTLSFCPPKKWIRTLFRKLPLSFCFLYIDARLQLGEAVWSCIHWITVIPFFNQQSRLWLVFDTSNFRHRSPHYARFRWPLFVLLSALDDGYIAYDRSVRRIFEGT